MAIPNKTALKKVISQHRSEPLKDVAKAIYISLNLAREPKIDAARARKHREEAGELLISLRSRVEWDGQDWWQFASDYFGRPRKELEKLMAQARANMPPHKSTTIGLSGLDTPSERLRALQESKVDALAESMKQVGQLHAITVRKRPGRGYWVVAGAHRLAAARKLKWMSIECVVLEDCSPDDAKLIEIDENLARAELSPAETAMHIGERKAIYERNNPNAKQGGAPTKRGAGNGAGKQKSQTAGFVSDTAAKTGKNSASIERDATRAKHVKVLPDIINTSLDKGSELDALAKLPADEQRALAKRAKAGEHVSARPARRDHKLPEPDIIKQVCAFHKELTSYTQEFVERIEAWHAANASALSDEGHHSIINALETSSMRLQLSAQKIDGRAAGDD